MLVLCAGNVLAVLTRGNAVLYWDQLWIVRMLAVLAFLWSVADIVSLPRKPLPALRLPVLCALVLAVPFWPLRTENGPAEMELYRFFGLCLALFIVLLHLVLGYLTNALLTNDAAAHSRRQDGLPLRLLTCLAIESTASAAVLLYGWPSRWQMFAWWTAIAFLSWSALTSADRREREVSLRRPLQVRV